MHTDAVRISGYLKAAGHRILVDTATMGTPKMPLWSPCLGMGYVEARHYVESWPRFIFSVSDCIIEMDILSIWFPGLRGKSHYSKEGLNHCLLGMIVNQK